MTTTRLGARVARLEGWRASRPSGAYWWELPDGEWHLGRTDISHEDAVIELDRLEAEERRAAEPDAGHGDDAEGMRGAID